MNTVWDWLTLILFAVLAMLFLQRSVGSPRPGDCAWFYLPPAIGCALANWLGNEGWGLAAGTVLALAALATVLIWRPIGGGGGPDPEQG
ncbi:XrtV sorting system accessory protein [Sphingomonas sp. FW199]|uniref:XrtV sorting system accessory protein n=1 Tax=Sphingomonas sp. FW199 TaxID=3400217 RepID=UPI003CEE8577